MVRPQKKTKSESKIRGGLAGKGRICFKVRKKNVYMFT